MGRQITSSTRILYLDIDGVLVTKTVHLGTKKNPPPFNKEGIAALNALYEKVPYEIRVTSTWNMHFSLQELQQIFSARGILAPVVGVVVQPPADANTSIVISPGRARLIYEDFNEVLRQSAEAFGVEYAASYAVLDDSSSTINEVNCNTLPPLQLSSGLHVESHIGLRLSDVPYLEKALDWKWFL